MNDPTTDEIIQRFKKKHGDRYDYSLVDYTIRRNNVKIICRQHGVFEQKPYAHEYGNNCPKCGRIGTTRKQTKVNRVSPEKHLSALVELHENKYDYSKVKEWLVTSKINIVCPIHGDFKMLLSAHKQGQGCPKCSMYRVNSICNNNVLYFLEVVGGIGSKRAFKVGCTSRRLKNRRIVIISSESGFKIDILRIITLDNANNLERELLSYGTNCRLSGFGGASEFRYFSDAEVEIILSKIDHKELIQS